MGEMEAWTRTPEDLFREEYTEQSTGMLLYNKNSLPLVIRVDGRRTSTRFCEPSIDILGCHDCSCANTYAINTVSLCWILALLPMFHSLNIQWSLIRWNLMLRIVKCRHCDGRSQIHLISKLTSKSPTQGWIQAWLLQLLSSSSRRVLKNIIVQFLFEQLG